MTAPRTSVLRALRQLSNQHTAVPRRALHITGVQSAQPANPADKASLYAARSLPDLKLECQRRSIRAAGSKSEVCTHHNPTLLQEPLNLTNIQLVERLSNHDALQTRAFSIAMRRINPNAFSEYVYTSPPTIPTTSESPTNTALEPANSTHPAPQKPSETPQPLTSSTCPQCPKWTPRRSVAHLPKFRSFPTCTPSKSQHPHPHQPHQ